MKNTADKKTTPKSQRKNRLFFIIVIAVLFAAAIIFILIHYGLFSSNQNQVAITVAWNPGSISDDIARVFASAPTTDTEMTIKNVTGANGATAANAVFQNQHDGTSLLSTNLSAFVTSEAIGFAESSHEDWTAWLCAFSPAVVVVANDSPYQTMNDLITTIQQNPGEIRCANEGFGTVSFIASELLSLNAALEIDHISFSGSASAVNALFNDEADFSILLTSDVAGYIRAEHLRAIGVFSKTDFALHNGNIEVIVPAIGGIDNRLDAVLPFGEYFGIFIPADTPLSLLSGLDSFIKTAAGTDEFDAFTQNAGLVPITPDRQSNEQIIGNFASIVCWTLYDTGFLPTNPDTLGISR